MTILSPNIRLDIHHVARALPNSPAITNLEIFQKFPRTASKPVAFQEKMAETITKELGFNTRYWVHKPWEPLCNTDETSEDLAFETVKKISPSTNNLKIDAFVLGSTTNARYTGSQASAVLGAFNLCAPAYDFKAGCSTSLASLHLAYALIKLGMNNILVSCAETMSKVIDQKNEKTWLGVADGAAALLLQYNPRGAFCVEKSFFSTDGRYVDAFTTRGILPPTTNALETVGYVLQGDETLLKNLAIKRYTEMLDALLPTAKDRQEITWLIPHQVNRRLIEELIDKYHLNHCELLWDADKIGNIGGASIS